MWVAKQLNKCNSKNYVQQRKQKQLSSSVVDHLITTGHVISRSTAVTVIYIHPNPYMLKYAKATAIGFEKPHLCKQDFITIETTVGKSKNVKS